VGRDKRGEGKGRGQKREIPFASEETEELLIELMH